jgi:hypothetical protein
MTIEPTETIPEAREAVLEGSTVVLDDSILGEVASTATPVEARTRIEGANVVPVDTRTTIDDSRTIVEDARMIIECPRTTLEDTRTRVEHAILILEDPKTTEKGQKMGF